MDSSPITHVPVLAETLAERISIRQDAVMVDATVGQAGHSLVFGKTLNSEGTLIGFDVDENSLEKAKSRLEGLACKVFLLRSNFSQMTEQLQKLQIEKVDFILADLGISSAQLTDVDAGLSFQINMPLDMRIDKRLKTTAADIVNRFDEKSLADLIFQFGQDRASRRIARFIVQYRQNKPIKTTSELATIVCRALSRRGPKKWSRIHPATRTFQALRIAVNKELENLCTLLDSASGLLKANGYIAVISFHSLEDRLVKNNFKELGSQGIYRILTKKPIVPSEQEIADNRRARSAKLRIAQKQ